MTFKSHELVFPSAAGDTHSTNQQGGATGSLAAIFSNLAVPAGLFYAQQTFPIGNDNRCRVAPSKTGVVPTSLFDNLTKLAVIKPKKTETKKRKNRQDKNANKKQRKTRRV